MRRSVLYLIVAGLLAGVTPSGVQAQNPGPIPQVTVDESAQAYRRIHIDVEYAPNEAVAGFEVWYSGSAFVSIDDAELHSAIRVAETENLAREPEGGAFDECWSDGLPVYR
ncbi:MAG: hypothetical protein OXI74_20410, partial [Rhodospirillaceae bacterium]|nr:hypothetical protein [Rhodospirillaceae bacterium]